MMIVFGLWSFIEPQLLFFAHPIPNVIRILSNITQFIGSVVPLKHEMTDAFLLGSFVTFTTWVHSFPLVTAIQREFKVATPHDATRLAV